MKPRFFRHTTNHETINTPQMINRVVTSTPMVWCDSEVDELRAQVTKLSEILSRLIDFSDFLSNGEITDIIGLHPWECVDEESVPFDEAVDYGIADGDEDDAGTDLYLEGITNRK